MLIIWMAHICHFFINSACRSHSHRPLTTDMSKKPRLTPKNKAAIFYPDQMLMMSSDYHKVWNSWDWNKGNAGITHWSSHNSIKADGYMNHKHLISSPDNRGMIFTACQSTQHSLNLKLHMSDQEWREEREACLTIVPWHLPNSLYTSF